MLATTISRFAASGSVVGAIALVAACASSEREPTGASGSAGSGGRGGSGGSGSAGKSSGGAGGSAGSSIAGSGGIAGSGCKFSDSKLSAGGDPGTHDVSSDAGASGAGGDAGPKVGDFKCINVYGCFSPPVAAPGFPFVTSAWAWGEASSVETVEVRSPRRGTICISGTNVQGGDLALALHKGDAPYTVLANGGPDLSPAWLFHAETLGITGLSFKVEPPPGIGVGVSIATAVPCKDDGPVWAAPALDGNPVVITASGTTTTLSLADFVSQSPPYPFDANAIMQLEFVVGRGPYDFCVSDLRFLDANGNEVTP